MSVFQHQIYLLFISSFLTSTPAIDPPVVIYMGKDKVESASRPHPCVFAIMNANYSVHDQMKT